MKILSVDKIREADQYTIMHEPIASLDLMERAAGNLYQRIKSKLSLDQQLFVFAGPGNNGGDGLVLSRLLARDGFNVKTFLVKIGEHLSPDFSTNLQKLEQLNLEIVLIENMRDMPVISEHDLVIDAIFGSGLNRPAEGIAAKVIEGINNSGAVVIAVDMPSGLFADMPANYRKQSIIKADYTYSFQFAKLAFLMPENDAFVGRWEIVPIGLHADFIERVETLNHLILPGVLKEFLHNRPKFSHKGTYGHALLIAGAKDKPGASILAAEACLRSGTGLLHVHLPEGTATALNARIPEAMISFDLSDQYFTKVPALNPFTAIGVGPGLGTAEATTKALKLLIQEAQSPLVLDADALNILADNKTWLSFLPASSIITPHPKEFERLAGKATNGFERLQLQRDFSVRYSVYVVLKGAHSSITTPKGYCWFNTTGNPGMATAGSGDVLTGLILGLLAQHYKPVEAALLGVYLHGLAGDLAAENLGMEAMIASDINNYLGHAFKRLRS
jgi:ADP-dependent NAD(P)H-hydrate dehydratase / NAD(P)H-hydrate epimerase